MKNIYIMSYKNIRIQGYLQRKKHNIQRYVHQDHGCQAIPSTINKYHSFLSYPKMGSKNYNYIKMWVVVVPKRYGNCWLQ